MVLLNHRFAHVYRNTYRAAKIFYLLFWLLKPFYLAKSGSMQIGDVCLGIAFLLVLYSDRMKIHIDEKDTPLFFFVIAVAIINTIYAAIYQNTDFVKPILYFIFNFMCVYITRIFLEDDKFVGKFNTILKFNLILQLGIFALGLGRWYTAQRYMGTYNDPNQLGFALLSTYCLIYCLNRKQHTKHQWIFFLISLFLIFETSSVGMFLGISLIFVFEQYFRLAKIETNTKRVWYIAYLVLISIGLVYAGSYFLLVVTDVVETEITVLQRIAGKFSNNELVDSFIRDRNLSAIFEEPHRILYGGGEGLFRRFAGTGNELHSTWLGILYYYGVIPFLLFLNWISNNIKRIDWYILPVYVCIFAEAFTLINHRQPSFWVLILMGSFLKRTTDKTL